MTQFIHIYMLPQAQFNNTYQLYADDIQLYFSSEHDKFLTF